MSFELSFQKSFDASFRRSFEASDVRSDALSFETSEERSDVTSTEISAGGSDEVSFRVSVLRCIPANSETSFLTSFQGSLLLSLRASTVDSSFFPIILHAQWQRKPRMPQSGQRPGRSPEIHHKGTKTQTDGYQVKSQKSKAKSQKYYDGRRQKLEARSWK